MVSLETYITTAAPFVDFFFYVSVQRNHNKVKNKKCKQDVIINVQIKFKVLPKESDLQLQQLHARVRFPFVNWFRKCGSSSSYADRMMAKLSLHLIHSMTIE